MNSHPLPAAPAPALAPAVAPVEAIDFTIHRLDPVANEVDVTYHDVWGLDWVPTAPDAWGDTWRRRDRRQTLAAGRAPLVHQDDDGVERPLLLDKVAGGDGAETGRLLAYLRAYGAQHYPTHAAQAALAAQADTHPVLGVRQGGQGG